MRLNKKVVQDSNNSPRDANVHTRMSFKSERHSCSVISLSFSLSSLNNLLHSLPPRVCVIGLGRGILHRRGINTPCPRTTT